MTKISTTQKSPIKISVVKSKSYFWCSCGFSKTQPFCDGSHKDTGKSPLKFVAIESKDLFFCACKKTKDQPLCDGSHST
ncbi:MAG: CDGSH iron-sulfur domain-containing protein [Proteobacteria bacterium]|jgi:CDGSH iron-sulfur domain-containing protein 3|nr:CDGSH iron-sulfur domain-containing protein [Pseudomonadota bacterium]